MVQLTDYQLEAIAAFIGNFGFVFMMLGYCAWFIHKGLTHKGETK